MVRSRNSCEWHLQLIVLVDLRRFQLATKTTKKCIESGLMMQGRLIKQRLDMVEDGNGIEINTVCHLPDF